MMCPLCGYYEDTQEHCLSCEKLAANKHSTLSYNDIYSSLIGKQVRITKLFAAILEERRQMLEQATSGPLMDPNYT